VIKLLVTFVLVCVALCDCSDKSTISVGPVTVYPQLAIKSGEHNTSESQTGSVPAQSTWEIQVAQFHDHQIAELGLKRLFEMPLRTNDTIQAALAENPLVGLARLHTNIALTVHRGTHIGLCSSEIASNLIEKFKVTVGVDLLTPPPAKLFGTNQSQVAVQNQITLALPSPGRRFVPTTNLAVGEVFDLRVAGMNRDSVVLEVAHWLEQFKGYTNRRGYHECCFKLGRLERQH
jgi:hypothetical protein